MSHKSCIYICSVAEDENFKNSKSTISNDSVDWNRKLHENISQRFYYANAVIHFGNGLYGSRGPLLIIIMSPKPKTYSPFFIPQRT